MTAGGDRRRRPSARSILVPAPKSESLGPDVPSPSGPSGVLLSGWGQAIRSFGVTERPRSVQDVVAALSGGEISAPRGGEGVDSDGGRGPAAPANPTDDPGLRAAAGHHRPPTGRLALRGLGRSYGDAAQLAGGRVLDLTGLDALLGFDAVRGVLEAEAGLSLDSLLRRIVPAGWFLPVTPGTRQVTLGGALAADVHGKNHHRDGSFSAHIESATLATVDGVRSIGPDRNQALFLATVGGMGLTGAILSLRLRLLSIETATMRVDTQRVADFDALVARIAETDASYRYSVAWVDLMARGRHLGRAVLTQGDHATLAELPRGLRARPLAYAPASRLAAPVTPVGLLHPLAIRGFNEAWYRKAPRKEVGRPVPLETFFHPLDGVRDWNRLYGPAGFLQWQVAVPTGAECVLRRVVEALARSGQPSFLAVLKRFGPASPAPLSFPQPGWTLAVDLPARDPELGTLLDRLDDWVTDAGGRTYLAKDARLRPALLPRQYPRLAEWRETLSRLDPDHRVCSDLCRRLDLSGTHRPGLTDRQQASRRR